MSQTVNACIIHHTFNETLEAHEMREAFWMVVPSIWFEIRVNYQLDANICLF